MSENSDQTGPADQKPDEPSEKEFEEMIAAALKVDPKRISGKHRREDSGADCVEPED